MMRELFAQSLSTSRSRQRRFVMASGLLLAAFGSLARAQAPEVPVAVVTMRPVGAG